MRDKVRMDDAGASNVTRLPVTDFWFAQVEARLSRVERVLTRIEWQVWVIVLSVGAMLGLEFLRALMPAVQ